MKKRNISEVLKNADTNNLKRIADSYDIISEEKKEKLYSRIAKNTDINPDTEFIDRVSGVEIRRSSNIARYICSAAACLAIIGAVSAGAFANGLKKIPSSESEPLSTTSETTTNAPTEPTTKMEGLPPEFDDEAKLHVFDIMINSADNFHKVSGQYVKKNTCSDIMIDICDYQIDNDNKKAYDHISRENLTSPVENVVNDAPFDSLIDAYMGELNIYYTDTANYCLDNVNKTYTIMAESDEYTGKGKKLDSRTVAGIIYKKTLDNDCEFDFDDETVFRNQSLLYNAAAYSVYPYDFALTNLSDFTSWEIKGEESYAGRNCYHIEGKNPLYPYDNDTAIDLLALVDKETGCLLKYILFTPDGSYYEWMVTKNIKFNDEAAPVSVDFSEYTKMNFEPVSNEIKYNNKGESYGETSLSISAYDYDDLPDLIAFHASFNSTEKEGYARKTELFDAFPISPYDESKRYASIIKGENTPAGIDINIYDSEGEKVLYTVTYYNPPVDDFPWLGHTDANLTFGPMTDDSYELLPDLIRYAVPDDQDDTVCYIHKSDIQDILYELPREIHMGYRFRWKKESDTGLREINCYNLNDVFSGVLVYDPQN
ncbi:hypothetical protein [Ruminococcus flavefaciens]|uniref:hypothetical protein n=1 Tax=Ruminococcus flavefaciens TaxID=1265 RepID=UPI0002F323C2|nr:hypothetical protein [Ruminococcus flavefaciens]